MSVCNQMSDPSQLWPINLVSLWRISWEQNTVGWYPVDVLFLLACGELLFVSTIYYLYTYLYCDTLPGQPFAQNAPAHTYTGRENIFPLQSPRLHAHTHTHTHTNLPQKCTPPTQCCPPPLVTTTQARFRDTSRQDLSTTLHMPYPSPPLSFNLLFLFFPSFLSLPLTTFCLQCQIKVTSSFWIFSGQTDTWGATTACTGCC